MKKQLKIILVLPNWLGDVIFVTPAFKAIKSRYPNSFLGAVAARRCLPILENNPYIDKIYRLDEKKEEKNFYSKIVFIKKIKKEKFNQAILLHRSFTKTFLFYLAGIKKRVGYAYPKRSFLLTGKIPCIKKDKVHKQDYYLNILEKSGINIPDKSCRININKTEHQEALELIEKNNPQKFKPLIGISPFTNWTPKNWPFENYLKSIKLILAKIPDAFFFLTSKNKFNQPLSKLEKRIVDLSEKTNIRQLAALYSCLDLVVSGDSGPLHLAAAVGTKYIGIFGPTNPNCTVPKTKTQGYILFENNLCPTPCYEKECSKNYICIKKITPERVLELTLSLLKKNEKKTTT